MNGVFAESVHLDGRIWVGNVVLLQFLFQQETSATSLAISSIAVNALSSTLGIIFFGTPVTVLLVVGVAETVLATCLYTFLKLNAKKEQQGGQ